MQSPQRTFPASLVVIVSFLVDFLDIILSLIVAIVSGSVVMLSQFLEGVSDLISSGLLLVGIAKARQKEDRAHPFGFGREIYVWALLSGIVTLTVSATLSVYFGWKRFISPEYIHNINLAFLVLIFTTFTNGFAFYLSLKRLLRSRSWKNIIGIFLHSSRIETKTTFVLDLMGMTASIVGIFALIFYQITGDLRFDGLGAIIIGIVLAILAYILLMGTVDLIVGRSASAEIEQKIRKATMQIPKVHKVMDLKTLHIGSEKLLVNIEVHLDHKLTTNDIEELVHKVKESIKKEVPQVKHVHVELETLAYKKSKIAATSAIAAPR